MASQFIQASQMSPIQGSIGQQSIVTSNEPTNADLIAPVLKTADMAGDLYSESKAKSIVNEEIENIDRVRAEAEKGQFTSGDPVPESLKADQKEWDMMAGAVQSGVMSRENARLIASSRIRARIAEEPFFADRMRKAASGVLGFNIESEGAQQYFNSFATNASIAQQQNASVDKEREKLMNEARRYKEVGIFDTVEEGYQLLVKNEAATARLSLSENELSMGGIDAQKHGSNFVQEEQVKGWGTLLGEVKAFEKNEGKPIDGVAFSRIINERRQDAKARLNASWTAGGAPLNTPAYDKALNNTLSIYDEMEEYANLVGVDNLTKVQIERNVQARELFGDKYFSTMKTLAQIDRNFANDVVAMAGMTPSQRERMFVNNPKLRDAYGLATSDPQEFNKLLAGAGTSLLTGEGLADHDPNVIDAAAQFMNENGSKEARAAAVQSLFRGGYEWKGSSLASSKSPRQSSPETIQTLTRQYKEGLKPAMDQLTDIIARDPTIHYEVGTDGKISVTQTTEQGAIPTIDPVSGLTENPREVQARLLSFRNAKQTADKINVFAQALGNEWSAEFGDTLDEYAVKLETLGKSGINEANTRRIETTNKAMAGVAGLIMDNDTKGAEAEYNRLRNENPLLYPYTFDEVLDEAMGE